ncbi:uncharacterized protein LOC123306874 [Coccinella septempunctata]|uniref:uncharacterized protein LOC123306874 n=1 Tax=Coccinella septempunctata TaxID=41139 RepID=UPI001D098FF8|nr:uncharacterized protein LOC123306874 [Coccinella septempunctata]
MWVIIGFAVLFTLCEASINESAHEELRDLRYDDMDMGSPDSFDLQQTVNAKAGQAKIEIDASRVSSRDDHGRQLVFLPFFRNNYRQNPSTFQRRTGDFLYRPLRRHCFYARKRRTIF